MSNQWQARPGGWKAAKANYARKQALGRHWKKRWQNEPDFMRASLDRLIQANREKWKAGDEALMVFAKDLPETMKSWEFKATIRVELVKLHQRTGKPPPEEKKVHRVYCNLIRKRIFLLGDDGMTWRLAKSP